MMWNKSRPYQGSQRSGGSGHSAFCPRTRVGYVHLDIDQCLGAEQDCQSRLADRCKATHRSPDGSFLIRNVFQQDGQRWRWAWRQETLRADSHLPSSAPSPERSSTHRADYAHGQLSAQFFAKLAVYGNLVKRPSATTAPTNILHIALLRQVDTPASRWLRAGQTPAEATTCTAPAGWVDTSLMTGMRPTWMRPGSTDGTIGPARGRMRWGPATRLVNG